MNTTPTPTPSYRTGKKIIKKRETVFYWPAPKVLGKELCVFRKNDSISLWKWREVEEDHGEVAGVSQEPVHLGVRKKGENRRREKGEWRGGQASRAGTCRTVFEARRRSVLGFVLCTAVFSQISAVSSGCWSAGQHTRPGVDTECE